MRGGGLAAATYSEVLLERLDRLRGLNAVIAVDGEAVRTAARVADRRRAGGGVLGPLHGLPLAIKDNIDVAGHATTCYSPPLAGNVASRDAAVVARLKAAGASVLCKTSMHELALGSPRDGDDNPINPHAPAHMTGGSSSGTAVAVAARLAPGGLGTDTGGSVRIPAAHCGLAGLRPTLGRYPSQGMVVLCPTRDVAGPMARTVADVALLDATLARQPEMPSVALEELRLGVARRYFLDDLAPETAAFAESEFARLRDRGATLIDLEIPDVARLNQSVSFVVLLHEAPRRLRAYVEQRLPGVTIERFVEEIASPGCKRLLRGLYGIGEGPFPPPADDAYEAAVRVHRPALVDAYRRTFAEHGLDALVYPTTPLPAGPVPTPDTVVLNGRRQDTLLTYLRAIDPSSNAGLPGITVPAGRTAAGVPLGLAFDGPAGSDRRLIAIGLAYEAIAPRLPPPATK